MIAENPFSLAQIIGYGAMITSISSLCFKSDRTMSKILAFTNGLWVLHFILLGALAGALNCGVHVLRSFAFLIHTERKRRWITFTSLIILYSFLGLSFMKHAYDLLPLIGSYTACLGLYMFHGVKTKLMFMTSNACFFVYSAIVFSIGGMIAMLAGIVVAFATIWRLRKDNIRVTV